MTNASTGSTVPRRQLGRHLRELRNKSRFTVKAAAAALEWSEPKLWRIETGKTSLRSHDVRTMCEVYEADTELTAALIGLAKETKAKGWWHSYGDVIPENFDVFIGLQEAAEAMDVYQSEVVPGLLQISDYARTIIRDGNPGDAQEEIDRRVDLRVDRQALLTRATSPPVFRAVLNEAVLRRTVGGAGSMADQLRHITAMSTRAHVKVRVVPFSSGLHKGVMSGAFTILRFPANGQGVDGEPPTVYADGFTGDLYLDKESEVARFDGAFSDMWDQALNEEASRRFIEEVAKDHDENK